MKTKSKALLLTLCAVLLVAASVLGTMAYLTDNDKVTNTFTVGKVSLGDKQSAGLDEAKVDEDGQLVYKTDEDGKTLTDKDGNPVLADRVQANTYKLQPGHTYVKDPTIHVAADSEDCFIRAKVTLTKASAWQTIVAQYANGKIENIIKGTDDNLWWVSAPVVDTKADTMTITFVYKNESKDESLKRVWQEDVDENDLVLFTNIVMPDDLTNEELQTVKETTITVVAEAIQADGFVESSNDATAAADAYARAMAALDAAKAGT